MADGLFDDARAGETDQRAGLGDVQVAQHGEAGGDAAGGGIGEHGDEGHARVVELREGGGDLGHLHQAHDALHHARSAGSGHNDERLAREPRAIDGAGNGFAHYGAHGATDEAVLHDADDNFMLPHAAQRVEDGVVEAGLLARLAQALLVGLDVDKIQRIGGAQPLIDELVSRLKQQIDARARVELEVMLALGAHLQVGFEFGFVESLAAAGAFDPQALGAHAFCARIAVLASRAVPRSGIVAVLTLKPRHTDPIVNGWGANGGRG